MELAVLVTLLAVALLFIDLVVRRTILIAAWVLRLPVRLVRNLASRRPVTVEEDSKLGLADLQGSRKLQNLGNPRVSAQVDEDLDGSEFLQRYLNGHAYYESLNELDPEEKLSTEEDTFLRDEETLRKLVEDLDQNNPHLTAEVVGSIPAPSDPKVASFVGLTEPLDDPALGAAEKITAEAEQ